MKKIGLTGATGLLGSHIARELYRSGFDVKVIVRTESNRRGIEDVPCEVYFGDICSEQDLKEFLSDCQAVIHAASMTDQFPNNLERYEKVNITAVQLLAKVVRELGLEKMVYVGTANTIGNGSKENPGDELNEFRLYKVGSGYVNSKYLAQKFLLEEAEKGLPASIVNPTFMIGPFDNRPSSGEIVLRGMRSKIHIVPPGGKNFIHVRDAALATISSLTKGKIGETYLLAGENLTYKEFYKLFDKVNGKKKTAFYIPKWALLTTGRVVDTLNALFGTSIPLTLANARLLCLDNYYASAKAKRDLNLRSTPITEAIKECRDWFIENNYVQKK